MIPASEVYLHEPPALSGLLPGESAEHTHYRWAFKHYFSRKAALISLLSVLACELSESQQTLGFMSASSVGTRPGNQHAGPTSKLLRSSACPLDWMLPKLMLSLGYTHFSRV